MARSSRDRRSLWPDAMLKPASAAALLDLSPSTWRCVWPVLVGHFGLRLYGVCGPKFRLTDVLQLLEDLRNRGLDIVVRKADGEIRIGDQSFAITSSRTGRSRRGRPATKDTG